MEQVFFLIMLLGPWISHLVFDFPRSLLSSEVKTGKWTWWKKIIILAHPKGLFYYHHNSSLCVYGVCLMCNLMAIYLLLKSQRLKLPVGFSFMTLDVNMSFEADLVDTPGVAEAGLPALIISPTFWILLAEQCSLWPTKAAWTSAECYAAGYYN